MPLCASELAKCSGSYGVALAACAAALVPEPVEPAVAAGCAGAVVLMMSECEALGECAGPLLAPLFAQIQSEAQALQAAAAAHGAS
jgi:hypothetical protein